MWDRQPVSATGVRLFGFCLPIAEFLVALWSSEHSPAHAAPTDSRTGDVVAGHPPLTSPEAAVPSVPTGAAAVAPATTVSPAPATSSEQAAERTRPAVDRGASHCGSRVDPWSGRSKQPYGCLNRLRDEGHRAGCLIGQPAHQERQPDSSAARGQNPSVASPGSWCRRGVSAPGPAGDRTARPGAGVQCTAVAKGRSKQPHTCPRRRLAANRRHA